MGCSPDKPQELFYLIDTPNTILKEDGAAIFRYWELENDQRLWAEELGKIPFLSEYRDSLKMILGEEEFTKAVQKEATQNLEKRIIPDTLNGDKKNAELVHSGVLGKVRPINFLEAQILAHLTNQCV